MTTGSSGNTNKSNSRKLSKWGNGVGIRIPKEFLAAANLHTEDEVSISEVNGQIIIEKRFKHKTFAERMAGYNGDYKATEFDWGKPVGNEVW